MGLGGRIAGGGAVGGSGGRHFGQSSNCALSFVSFLLCIVILCLFAGLFVCSSFLSVVCFAGHVCMTGRWVRVRAFVVDLVSRAAVCNWV